MQKTETLPHIVANNYLRKLLHSPYSAAWRGLYWDQWPFHITLTNDQPSPALCCPAHMHGIVWGASQSTAVRVFSRESQHLLEPVSVYDPVRNETHLHVPRFSEHGFTPELNALYDRGESAVSGFLHTELQSEEFLFVPSGQAFSAALLFGSGEESTPVASRLSHLCFVDASNLREFRKALQHIALVGEAERQLLRDLTTIDTSMQKQPLELLSVDYAAAPAGPGTESSAVGGAEAVMTAPKKKSDRRKKSAGVGTDFRDWQQTNQWNLLIRSLTVPVPFDLEVLNVERTRAELSWASDFVPHDSDKSFFGFTIHHCAVARERECLNTTVTGPELVALQPGRFHVTVSHLVPGWSYVFSVALVYDKAQSAVSSPSSPVTTVALSRPTAPLAEAQSGELQAANLVAQLGCRVDFAPPSGRLIFRAMSVVLIAFATDDGGSPILG